MLSLHSLPQILDRVSKDVFGEVWEPYSAPTINVAITRSLRPVGRCKETSWRDFVRSVVPIPRTYSRHGEMSYDWYRDDKGDKISGNIASDHSPPRRDS
jgi:hypothetical protein